jgi:myo-inositol-1(or 4)-monophosphatase
MIEHTKGNIWYAEKDKGCFLNGRRVHTTGLKRLVSDSDNVASVYIDWGPCPDEYVLKFYSNIINCSLVRNLASSGIHLAHIASGIASAGVICGQKPDELTAGYLMIKEAGGVVLSWAKRDIGEELFDFKKKYPNVAAATYDLAIDVLERNPCN